MSSSGRTHRIIRPSFERRDERGVFREVLNSGSWESVVAGRMKAGAVLGHHYHKKTTVFLHVLTGAAHVKTRHVKTGRCDEFTLSGGDGVMLRPNHTHAVRFTEESDFLLLKSHRYHPRRPDTYHDPIVD